MTAAHRRAHQSHRTPTGAGGVVIVEVPVDTGDVDVQFVDSLDLGDALSGTLGPVNAEDSYDLKDELVVEEFNAQDSVAMSDSMAPALDLDVGDSISLNDQLSGTLGPVNAIDSLDVADSLDVDAAVLQDSLAISDAPSTWSITATQPDSVDLGDVMSVVTVDDVNLADSLDLADMMALITSIVADSMALADSFGATSATVVDSIDISDQIVTVTLSATMVDSLDLADVLAAVDSDAADSIALSALRSPVDFTGTLWPNAQVSNSGWANPANMTDTNTGTAATGTATSSGAVGTGGTNNTTNVDLIVSCGNPDLSDWTIDDVTLEWSVTATTTGAQLTAGTCVINYQYSLNDGTSWTTFFAQTAQNGSTSSLSIGGATQDVYEFTGSEESFVIPAGVTSITVDMAGGQGGADAVAPVAGGLGTRLQATLTVTPGETIYIGVAGRGADGVAGTGGTGGFYDAGNGGAAPAGANGAGGGGGQSYIKRGGTADSNRVLVAAGGGGSGGSGAGGNGSATILTQADAASSATDGANTGPNGGGGSGWQGGAAGTGNLGGNGGIGMAHSTQTSGASATAAFQSGDGYVSLTYGASAITETQIQQLRFRGVGAVTSGTGLLPVSTTANWFYTRAVIQASKTYA